MVKEIGYIPPVVQKIEEKFFGVIGTMWVFDNKKDAMRYGKCKEEALMEVEIDG